MLSQCFFLFNISWIFNF